MDNETFKRYTQFQEKSLTQNQKQSKPLREQYPIKEKDLNTPIHALELKPYEERILLQQDIDTIQSLSYQSYNTLITIKGIKRNRADHIIDQYIRYILK